MGNVNLARIPEDWGLNQIAFLDSAVLGPSGKPSIRIEPHTGADVNQYRECNTKIGYAVKPGDHIVMKAWIKTGHSTLGQDGVSGNGGFPWFDYYGKNGRLHEHSTDDPRGDVESWFTWNLYKQDPGRYVPFNSDWTLRVLDTIVPELVVDDKTVTPDGFSMGVPTAIIPGVSASGYIVTVNGVPHQQDQGLVWFADAELYINPDQEDVPPGATASINESGETVWTANGYSGNLGGWTDKIAEQTYDALTGVLSVKVVGAADEAGTRHYWTNTVNVVTGIVSGWVMGDVVPKAGRFLSLSSVATLAIGSVGMLWLLNELRSKKRQRRRR